MRMLEHRCEGRGTSSSRSAGPPCSCHYDSRGASIAVKGEQFRQITLRKGYKSYVPLAAKGARADPIYVYLIRTRLLLPI